MSRPEEVADSVTRILEDRAGSRPASPMRFGDSIEQNLETLREVLSQLPTPMKRRARNASIAIERAIMGLRKNSPDGATALGVMLAAHVVSQRLIEGQTHGDEPSLIQLVS
ncbi:MAG: hypothetical protein ACREUG_11655 [Steroidobacteraceae bacterium]